MKTKEIQFSVSKRAIVARINRHVAKDQKQFVAVRSQSDRQKLGPWAVMQGAGLCVNYDPKWTLTDWANHFKVLAHNEKIDE
jgi:hypothetical protein